jgi:hypothetical protein
MAGVPHQVHHPRHARHPLQRGITPKTGMVDSGMTATSKQFHRPIRKHREVMNWAESFVARPSGLRLSGTAIKSPSPWDRC